MQGFVEAFVEALYRVYSSKGSSVVTGTLTGEKWAGSVGLVLGEDVALPPELLCLLPGVAEAARYLPIIVVW